MDTEKATDVMDLPHAYIADRAHPDSECRCGREKAHSLHGKSLVEKAAAGVELLITEKGT